jgi:DNA-binding PadR family transcriptional regulator
LSRLPEAFTRRDVGKELGYEPDRGSLYRILQELVEEEILYIESVGTGQIPTVYRKTGAPDAAASG